MPTAVSASSFIDNRGTDDDHLPEHAFDGDPATAWNEAGRGPGSGEWLQADFGASVQIRQLRIVTGWDFVSPRSGDLFVQNSHLRRVRVVGDGGTVIAERDVGENERGVVLDGLDVRTRTLRIDAMEVWAGTRWQDLCLGEVDALGPADAAGTATVTWALTDVPGRAEGEVNTTVALVLSGAISRRIDLDTVEGRCERYVWRNARLAALTAVNCPGGGGTTLGVFRIGGRLTLRRQDYTDGEHGEAGVSVDVASVDVPSGVAVALPVTP